MVELHQLVYLEHPARSLIAIRLHHKAGPVHCLTQALRGRMPSAISADEELDDNFTGLAVRFALYGM